MKMIFLQSKRVVRSILLILLVGMAGLEKTFGQYQNYLTLNGYASDQTDYYVPFNGQFDSNQPTYSQFIIPASDLTDFLYQEIYSLRFYLYDYGNDIDIKTPKGYPGGNAFQIYFAEVDNEVFYYWQSELYDYGQMTLVFDSYEYGDYYYVENNQIEFSLHYDYDTYSYYQYNGGNLLVYVKPIQISNPYECAWQGNMVIGMEGYASICQDEYYTWGIDFKPRVTFNGVESYQNTTNSHVPFDMQFYSNQPSYSQFIIPASELSSVQYGEIQSLSFYLSKDSYYSWEYDEYVYPQMPNWNSYNDQFQIYFAEVDNENFAQNGNWEYELLDESQMTLVYDGANYYDHYGSNGDRLDVYDDGDHYKVQFYLHHEYEYEYFYVGEEESYLVEVPHYFPYYGGNLLVYIKPTQMYSTNNCQWLGVSQDQWDSDGPAALYYDGENAYTQGEYFKPMITIEYSAGEAPSCLKPQHFTAVPEAHYADVWWDYDANGYTLQYKKSTDYDWTTVFENEDYEGYTIYDLTRQTEYEVRVKAVCGEGDESDWNTLTFTTTAPLAPTYLTAQDYDSPEANIVTLNWYLNYEEPPYWDIAYTTDMGAYPNNSTIITINEYEYYYSYSFTDLTPFATYKVWIRSNYGDGDVSDWSEPCVFTLTNWENVTVNQGSYKSNYYVPYCAFVTPSKSQFIIPASELSDLTAHELTRIKFNPSDSWNLSTVNLKIYLKEVAVTEFSSTEYYDWDGMELVYDGSFSRDMAFIEFDDFYYYTGGNLLVGVQATGNVGSYAVSWSGIETSGNTALANYHNNTPSLYQFLPRTTFYYIPAEASSCITPIYLTCNSVTGTTAILDWTTDGDETAWDIYYSIVATAPDENTTPNVIATTQKPCTIEGLVPETTYYAWVRANCGESKSHWSQSCEFLPTDRIDLTVNDGTSYFVGAPISSSNNSNIMKTQMVIPAEDLTSMVNGEIQKLYFYSSSSSVSFSGHFTVYVTEIGTSLLGDDFYDWAAMEQLCYQGTLSVSDHQMVIDFDVPYKYEGGNLLIGVVGDGSYVSGPYWYGVYGGAYGEAGSSMYTSYYSYNGITRSANKPKTTISYIEGVAPVVARPQGLSANNITENSADLSWNGMENVSWNLRYKTAEATEWTVVHPTSNSYQMTGLPTNTTYLVQVQAVNGANHSSWSYLASFTTLCEMFVVDAEHPYTNDFNSDPTEECWVADSWRYYSSYMYADGDNASLWMPSMHINASDTESVYLSFNTDYENALCSVVINDVLVWSSIISEDWMSTFVILSLDDYRGQDVSVKFQFENMTYGSWDVYDVRLGIGLPMEYANIFEIEGEWSNPNNWSTGAAPTIEQDVLLMAPATVPSGAIASANSITSVYGKGSVTIADGGQVDCNNNFEGTIQKNIAGYGNGQGNWCLISIPNINSYYLRLDMVDNLIENEYDLYYFDQYQQQAEWVNTKQLDNNYLWMYGLTGYLYANSTDVTLSYTNMLNVYEYGRWISNSGDTYPKMWYLIGNPMTCNAYIDRAFYKMNGTGTALEAVEANTPIRPMEGVFVEIASTEQEQYLTFSKSSNSSKDGGMAKGLRMDLLQEQSSLDNAIVSFGEGATLGKFMLNPNGSKIYFTADGKDYAIVRAGTSGEMPLNFEAAEDGRYTISVNTKEVEMSYLHLIDNLTGKDINLLETPEYSFDAKATDNASRFKMVFAK